MVLLKDLQNLFSHYGIVTTVKVIFDRVTGRSKRYGFVEMPNDAEGQAAIDALNGTRQHERDIVVAEAKGKRETDTSHSQPAE